MKCWLRCCFACPLFFFFSHYVHYSPKMHYCQLSCFWIKLSGLEDQTYTRQGIHSFFFTVPKCSPHETISYLINVTLVEQRAHRDNWQDLSFLLDGLLSLFYLDWGLVLVLTLIEMVFMVCKTQMSLPIFLVQSDYLFSFTYAMLGEFSLKLHTSFNCSSPLIWFES